MNIYQKMSAISIELQTVAKNLEVGYGTNKYKAVGEADVLRAVKPLENKYGVYSYPVERLIEETEVFETTNSKGQKVNNKFMRVKTVYRFINVEDPNEYIDITSYGDGVDSQDKTPGKAMTYADKYALLKAYKIQTGDDPDQQASAEGSFKASRSAQSEKKSDMASVDDAVLLSVRNRIEAELEARMISKEFVCGLYKIKSLEDASKKQLDHMAKNMAELEKKQEAAKNE